MNIQTQVAKKTINIAEIEVGVGIVFCIIGMAYRRRRMQL